MNTFGERLAWALDRLDWTQSKLAKELGVRQSTVSSWIANSRTKTSSIPQISELLGVNARWLQTGVGPAVASPDQIKQPVVPLISWVRAGAWDEANDQFNPGEADEWEPISKAGASRHAFALRVHGDSMTAPYPGETSFPEGTVIVVDPERQPSAGDYVIAKDIATQRATFKQLVTDGARWYLKPLNPAYPLIEIDDPKQRVIGRVIEYTTRKSL